MGNVQAQQSTTFNSPFNPAPLSSPNVEEAKTPEVPPMELPEETNPGTVEDLHKLVRDLSPLVFEGAKFSMNKPLSSHLQVSHNINLSTVQPPGYRFGATYLGTPISQTEVYPILLGDIDPQGNLNANIIHQFYPGVKSRFVAQIEGGKWNATQATTEYFGKHFTLCGSLANVNVFDKSGLGVFHYLHQVTNRLALGAEVAMQKGPQVPHGLMLIPSVAFKYRSTTGSQTTGTVGTAGIRICHYQKCSDTLQIGADLETSLTAGETVASTAFQLDIPKGDSVFKGKLDSNGTVTAVFEKKLQPLPFTLALSAMHSHSKDKFRVGVGFTIG